MKKKTVLAIMLGLLPLVYGYGTHAASADEELTSSTDAVVGDWDLGQNFSAFRISVRDQNSIFVQFCDRSALLSNHVCNSSVILYFNLNSAGVFAHTDPSGQHLNATLEAEPGTPPKIHYQYTSDAGSGDLIGARL